MNSNNVVRGENVINGYNYISYIRIYVKKKNHFVAL